MLSWALKLVCCTAFRLETKRWHPCTKKSSSALLYCCYHQLPYQQLPYCFYLQLQVQDQDTPNTILKESLDAHQDISFWSNIVQTGRQGDFSVSPDTVTSAMQSCRSKQNLAARSAAKNITVPERSRSNCCGVLEKKALDVKVVTIYPACMLHFLLQCLETQLTADKGMRTAIDELCGKTKFPTETENC